MLYLKIIAKKKGSAFMNIAVISPDNRGCGATSIALLVGAALKNRGESCVVMSLDRRSYGLREYVGDAGNLAEKNGGIENICRLLASGSLNASDVDSYCVDCGVDILPGGQKVHANDIGDAISFLGEANINGRSLYTIVDVDIRNMADKLVETEIKEADVIVVVLTQNCEHIRHIRENRNNMSRAFAGKRVCFVVNKYDKFAGTLKEVYTDAGFKKGDDWYEVRYNKCVVLMTAKHYIKNVVEALKDGSDPDVAELKADIERLAFSVIRRK